MAPRPERIGQYAITGVLGQGGMGVVFKGRHVELGVDRALKLMLRGDAHAQARFERESTHLARVRHDNVVRIHESGVHEQQPYFVMDLLEGRGLDEVLKAGRPPLRQALGWAVSICRGVDALHALGVIHRDLKPSNIIITHDGRPVVVDVGLALAPELDDRLTKTGGFVGTFGYMAPEQLGKGDLTTATDVFVLGLIVHELVTGLPAVDEDSTAAEVIAEVLGRERPLPGATDPDLPASLDDACRRATARETADRFQRAGELADALEEVLRRPGPTCRQVRRRRRAVRAVAGAAVVSALAAGGWAVARGPGEQARVAGAEEPDASELLRELSRAGDPALVVQRFDAWLAEHPAHPDRARVEARRRDARRKLGDVGLRALRERTEHQRGTPSYLAEAVAWLEAWPDHPEAGSLRTVVRATARRVPIATLGPAHEARFVPGSDGGRALLTYHHRTTQLWDLARGGVVREWPFGGFDVELTSDGRFAYLLGATRIVGVRLGADAVEEVFDLGRAGLMVMALSPDGSTLAVGDNAGVVQLVSTTTRAVVGALPPLPSAVYALDWSRSGDRLFVGNWGSFDREKAPQVFIADVAAREYRRAVPVVGNVTVVLTTADDRRAIIGTGMGRIFLLDLESDARPVVLVGDGRPGDSASAAEPPAARGDIGALKLTSDGRFLLSASFVQKPPLGDLSTWDLVAGREVRGRSLIERPVAMWDLDLSPRGDRLLVACGDDPAEVWLRLEDGE